MERDLRTRARESWGARRLVESGRVYRRPGLCTPFDDTRFVVVDDDKYAYVVDLAAETCDCERAQCDHLLAAVLYRERFPWYPCGTPFVEAHLRQARDLARLQETTELFPVIRDLLDQLEGAQAPDARCASETETDAKHASG
jgi:hypothetical protein